MVAMMLAAACSAGGDSGVPNVGGGSSSPGWGRNTPRAAKVPESSIGGTLDLTLDSAQVAITLTSAELHDSGPEEHVKPGGVFLVADFSFEVKAGVYEANPYNFVLILKDGSRVQTEGGWFEPALHGQELLEGQTASGKVTFDVPVRSSAGSKIAVTYGFSDQGYWLFG